MRFWVLCLTLTPILSHGTQPYRIYTVALANGEEPFSLTEAFDGISTEEAALSIVGDGVPQFHVETVADGQAAWTYDIFFTAPHLGNVPELVVFDEGTGERSPF